MFRTFQGANPTMSYSRYVDDLREFFALNQLHFGAPEDIVRLADEVSRPGMFESEMGAIIRTIILREGGNPTIADLLAIVTVAIGGPGMEERSPEFAEPIHRIVRFLGTAFMARRGFRPKELADNLPPRVPRTANFNKVVADLAPETRAATHRVYSSARILAAREISEELAADEVLPVLDAPPGLVPAPPPQNVSVGPLPAKPEVKLEPLVYDESRAVSTAAQASPPIEAGKAPRGAVAPHPELPRFAHRPITEHEAPFWERRRIGWVAAILIVSAIAAGLGAAYEANKAAHRSVTHRLPLHRRT